MKAVKIAEFKSRLSAHLKEVRRGGELIILDRETPIARVSPVGERMPRIIVKPARRKGGLAGLIFNPVSVSIDVVQILRDDRDRR